MEIYISKDSQILGPYRGGEICTRLEDGSFDGTELACHGDLDKWVSLQELGELNEKVKEDQSAHEVELKNMKVEHEMESRELQRTIEEERATHGRAIAELNQVKMEANAAVQKMLDLEADHAAERAKQALLHQLTEEAIKSMHQSCINELTAEAKRLKRENLDLEKASQNN